MDLISIIIPVYKVEKYIRECIDSVVGQTYPNLDIILIDDGSPDACGKICDEYKEKDSRIRVIHKSNGGLSDARNTGILAAQGKWLMFVDSDDYIVSTMVEELYVAATSVSAQLAICSAVAFRDTNSMRVNNYEWLKVESQVCSGIDVLKSVKETQGLRPVYVIAWNKLYQRDIFQTLRYPKGYIHEDEAVAHWIFGMCDKIIMLDRPLYYYRQVEGSITSGAKTAKHLDLFFALVNRVHYYEKNGLTEYSKYVQDNLISALFKEYYQIIPTKENRNQLKKCRKLVATIIPYYWKRKEIKFRYKMIIIVFCCFPTFVKKYFFYKNNEE